MDALRRFFAQLRDFFNGLSLPRRVALAAAAVGVVLAAGVFTYLSQSATRVPVYKDLAPDEAGAMRTLLAGQNIPSELSRDGTAILVPEDRLAEARVALASGGLPSRGGRGYELFDETSLMTTPFVQSVNYQRALQAELARSIGQLEAVQSARVLIARPEPTPFLRDQRPPTASVVLKLKPGATMSRAGAAGVVSLVARSVEGLKPENVTVIDGGGRVLSDPHAADRDSLPTPQLEYREKLETYLASKAEKMLSQHLGPGRAVVQVSADINFQKVRERQETFPPDSRVAIAERILNSTSTGVRSGGVVGAVSNVARAGGTLGGGSGSGGGGGNSKDERIETDYVVPRTVRELEDGLGAVTRLSIAALVDLAPGADGAAVIAAGDVEDVIKRAIGFRTGRDEVKVSNVRLTGPAGPAEPDETLTQIGRIQAYVGLARNVSLALGVVLVVAIAGLLLVRRRAAAPPAEPAPAAADEARREGRRAAGVDRLADLARAAPDRVADVLRLLVGGPAR
ncbi:MAG: flagellar M-ring protein FliF [Isosphaera sp.]|nr:flagellar M-ring protein FliF [Isosphaera sp.]